jgi:adenylate cyclase, class 2
LKARDADPERSLFACRALDAEAKGTLSQRDTYFRAARGRLKLREEDGSEPHLIAYERADRAEQRQSLYRVVPVIEVDRLKASLADALGVEVVVSKERKLFIWERVRIHLDVVEGLGHFVEFEAIVDDEVEIPSCEARIAALMQAFELEDADLVASSYSDLARAMSEKPQQPSRPGRRADPIP